MRLAFPRLSKPPIGTPLDASSELQRGLFYFAPMWEGGGQTFADVVNSQGGQVIGAATWGPGSSSTVLNCTAVGAYGVFGYIAPALNHGWPITMAVAIRTPAVLPSVVTAIFDITYDGMGTSPYDVIAIQWSSVGTIGFAYNSAGSFGGVVGTFTPSPNTDYVLSLTITPTVQTLYVNGVAVQTTAAAVSNPTWTSTSFAKIGGAGGTTAGCKVYWAGLWNRALSPTEHAAAAQNIWQIFQSVWPLGAIEYQAPPTGSLRVQASGASEWIVQTASNAITTASTYSLAFAVRFNQNLGGLYDMLFAGGNQSFELSPPVYTTLNLRAYGSGGGSLFPWVPTIGETYFVALSYTPTSATWYIQGQAAYSTASPGTPGASPTYIQLGQSQAYATDYDIAQLAFWNGYALTQADALSLRGGAAASTISPGNLAAYWTLSGTLGATPTIGDAGLNDISGNGVNFTTQTGTATGATYGPALSYTPPTLVTPYVSKSGQDLFFFAPLECHAGRPAGHHVDRPQPDDLRPVRRLG